METTWKGFSKPTTTPVPDELFDIWLSDLSGSELKVLLYIIRRTFGFKKDDDAISLSQICTGITTREGKVLDRGTGLARTTASKAVKNLEASGLIIVERSHDESGENEVNTYRLRFQNDVNNGGRQPGNQAPDRGSSKNEPGVVRKSNHPSEKNGPPVVRKSHPQQTALQETDSQQTEKPPAPPVNEDSDPQENQSPGAAGAVSLSGHKYESAVQRADEALSTKSDGISTSVEMLVDFGIWRRRAEQAANRYALTPDWVERACAAMSNEAIRGRFDNPQAVLLSRIEAGWEPPPIEEPASSDDEDQPLEFDVDSEAIEAEIMVLPPVVDSQGLEHDAGAWFETVKEDLKLQLARETYDTWIRPAKLIDFQPPAGGEPAMLTIQLHNLYARKWIQQRLHKVVKRIVDRKLDADVTIEYRAPSEDGANDTEKQAA